MIKDPIYKESGPDPSALTTQQLLREVESLKELLSSKIISIEKAVQVAHDDLVRVPTDVQKAVESLKDLTFQKIEDNLTLVDEKFLSLNKQLQLIESARVEQKKDQQTAVDAALRVQKEAVSELNESNLRAIVKSEASLSKQIDQIQLQLSTMTKSYDDKLSDFKELAGIGKGKSEGIGLAWGIFLSLVGLIGIIFGIVMAFK